MKLARIQNSDFTNLTTFTNIYWDKRTSKPDGLHKRSVDNTDEDEDDEDDDEEEDYEAEDVGDSTVTLMRGGQTMIACFSVDLEPNRLVDPKVKWYANENEPLVDGRLSAAEDGFLKVVDAEAQDAGTYSCTLDASDENGNRVVKSFKHVIIVYVLPDLYYDVVLKYTSASCDTSLKDQKVIEIKKLCSAKGCRTNDVSGRCHSISGGAAVPAGIKHQLWVSLKILPPKDMVLTTCDVTCMEKEMMDKLNVGLSEVKKFVKMEAKKADKSQLKIGEEGMTSKLYSTCTGGYRSDQLFCVPCSPGSYSKNEQSVCVECPRGKYQPSFATQVCIPCAPGTNTTGSGANSRGECKKTNVVIPAKSTKTVILAILFLCVFLVLAIVLSVRRWMSVRKGEKAERIKQEEEEWKRTYDNAIQREKEQTEKEQRIEKITMLREMRSRDNQNSPSVKRIDTTPSAHTRENSVRLEPSVELGGAQSNIYLEPSPFRRSSRARSNASDNRSPSRRKSYVGFQQSYTDADIEDALGREQDSNLTEDTDNTVSRHGDVQDSHSPEKVSRRLSEMPAEYSGGVPEVQYHRRNTLHEAGVRNYQPYLSEALHVLTEEPIYATISPTGSPQPHNSLSPPTVPPPPLPPYTPPAPMGDHSIETHSWYGTA